MTNPLVSSILCTSLAVGTAWAADMHTEKKAIYSPSEEKHLKDLPFSPAIQKDGTLYVSGQAGYGSNGKTPEDFEEEVKTSLNNVHKVLQEAGYDFSDVVTVNVYLTDMGMIERMNAVYKQFFPEPRPARTTVAVAKLVGTARVEITVVAKK